MRFSTVPFAISVCASLFVAGAEFDRVYLASVPRPLPDGKSFVFMWRGDIWRASIDGGTPTQLTRHPAEDHWPCVSPDGREVAFSSMRSDSRQIHVVPVDGGEPQQITHHTEGYRPLAWFPDGQAILAHGVRDHAGQRAGRLLKVFRQPGKADELLFDAYAYDADVSPDGKRILFTREGVALYRRGYRGSKASQIWLYDLTTREFTSVRQDSSGARSPLWKPDGNGFYFLSQEDGCFNLWDYDMATGNATQRTRFTDASVIIPGLSRDGHTMVFRQLFDFYRHDPTAQDAPVPIRLAAPADLPAPGGRRRWYTNAWNNDRDGTVSFTDDGLQICFTAGGDLWVMDTVLKEPRQLTTEAGIHETEATFAPDGNSIVFLRDFGDRVEVWRATRRDVDSYWWQNREFALEPMVTDKTAKHNLSLSPDGTRLSYCVDPGGVIVCNADGAEARQVAESAGRASYDWAPDGKWLVCTLTDSNHSRDVWIVSVDGVRPPYNVSRHPKSDNNARWSPDGRLIAFVGRRENDNPDVCYVYLREADDEETKRDRTLDLALAKMSEGKKNGKNGNDGKTEATSTASDAAGNGKKEAAKAPETVTIDFEGLADRVRRLDLKEADPGHLFWSFDSKALAFHATVGGKRGTYKAVFPDDLKPSLVTEKTGTQARWIEDGSKIVWLVDRIPAHLNNTFPFKAFQHTDIVEYQRLAFRLIWRTMRDRFYDASLNRLDWRAVLQKYEDAAAHAPDRDVFERVVAMLLGELNASHMGFSHDKTSKKEWEEEWSSRNWHVRTGHAGLRFDMSHEGPGLKVTHVIADGPTDRDQSRVNPGDVILKINGETVTRESDLAPLLTGVFPRDDRFLVSDANAHEREVTVRTVSHGEARDLLREEEIRASRKRVGDRSNGTLGYLHIAKMQWADLHKFEREVFSRGTGKDGLVIDVRGNTGGFVADRLLEILCRPMHAVTIPRGGDRGYPADYLGKAVWDKPLVVLCDQDTTSNGEIFCHAIKTLGRGKIVGVPTQGAVIATPDEKILDMGVLRVPERGWFVGNTGQDMELNGCVPDIVLWPQPGELPAGVDHQLDRAVDVLLAEVEDKKRVPPLELTPASRLRVGAGITSSRHCGTAVNSGFWQGAREWAYASDAAILHRTFLLVAPYRFAASGIDAILSRFLSLTFDKHSGCLTSWHAENHHLPPCFSSRRSCRGRSAVGSSVFRLQISRAATSCRGWTGRRPHGNCRRGWTSRSSLPPLVSASGWRCRSAVARERQSCL